MRARQDVICNALTDMSLGRGANISTAGYLIQGRKSTPKKPDIERSLIWDKIT